jgi:signal transduction histidine kinase
MPSPKTEPARSWADRLGWPGVDPRGFGDLSKRLNARIVLALAAVTLVGLVTSGVAISQILPGYFIEQTRQRVETAVGATAVDLQQRVNEAPSNTAMVPELRENRVLPGVALQAARIYNATVEIHDEDGRRILREEPSVPDDALEQGLRRDTGIEPVTARVPVALPDGSSVVYFVTLRDPYTNRAATLSQIQSALIGAGFLALAVSLVIGVLAARSLAVPIGRLRRVAGRIATGNLGERAVPSGILEIDELAQQFNIMADQLSGTLSMLEADRDRLREFVADVSHELRTPIAALRMYTELQSNADVDDGTRREFLERSIEQIGRLEWLSTNLLDLSRIDAGIFPLDMRTGDLRDPVQAVVQALSEEALARGVSLESTVPQEPVELRFDRERIVQLMTNLVGNALKFTPRGGGASVQVDDGEAEVVITVRDTGPGIPADELPRIFERFYRGTNTGDARASGSGLGLAIARSIVEMHGGSIEVGSELGSGTEFRIHLPRAREASAEVQDEPDKVNETSRARRPARNPGTVG